MMPWAQALTDAVPSTKALLALAALLVAAFWAGVGATFRFSDYADLPNDVRVLQAQRMVTDTAIANLRTTQVSARRERLRILCLVRLTATGEEFLPVEIDERCP